MRIFKLAHRTRSYHCGIWRMNLTHLRIFACATLLQQAHRLNHILNLHLCSYQNLSNCQETPLTAILFMMLWHQYFLSDTIKYCFTLCVDDSPDFCNIYGILRGYQLFRVTNIGRSEGEHDLPLLKYKKIPLRYSMECQTFRKRPIVQILGSHGKIHDN